MTGALRRALVRVGAMASKETTHVLRDPRTLYLALAMPVVLLLLFGFGISTDLDHLPLAVADLDRSEASRALVRAMVASEELVAAGPSDAALAGDADRLFRRGLAAAVLEIPRDYGARLARGERVALGLLVDASDVTQANQVLAKAEALVRAHGAALAGPAGPPPLQAKVWTRYNPAGRSALFMVPGLAAFIVALTAVLLTTLTVAGEWERGSMESLFATPVSRLEIVLGKLAPYLVLGMLELLLVVAVGATVFDVPVRGNPLLVLAIGLPFLVGMLGQGLLVSVVTRNQLVATQVGLMSALLPGLLLSGMIFPIANMPVPLQVLSRVVPARYLVHALRGVLLKGNGLDVLWPDLLAVTLFAVAVVGLATARFQRRVA